MEDENLKICEYDEIGVSDAIKIGFTQHQTNRSAVYHDSQNPTNDTELDTLIRKFVEIPTDELRKFILPLVQNFSTKLNITTPLFFVGFLFHRKRNLSVIE